MESIVSQQLNEFIKRKYIESLHADFLKWNVRWKQYCF